MNDLPAWAREKAQTVYLDACLYGLTDNEWIDAIARALVAEYERGVTDGRDDVAVERRERDAYARGVKEERERRAKIIDDNSLGNHGLVPRHDGDVHGLSYAAAIRNQEGE